MLDRQAQTIEEAQNFVETEHFAFIYVSRVDCGVCHAVLPQVKNLLEDYPQVKLLEVDADKVPGVAGAFSVLTVPALLMFVDGKEMLRKARFVVMSELEREVAQIVENY